MCIQLHTETIQITKKQMDNLKARHIYYKIYTYIHKIMNYINIYKVFVHTQKTLEGITVILGQRTTNYFYCILSNCIYYIAEFL